MLNETIRIVADAYRDGTIGVNAQLSSVPILSGHETPPDLSEIATVIDDQKAAREETPANSPALILAPFGDYEVDGGPLSDHLDARGGGVQTLYFTKNKNAEKAARHGYYTLRACLWSLIDLFNPNRAGSEADRNVNSIQLISIMDHRIGTRGLQLDVGAITATMESRFEARELLP